MHHVRCICVDDFPLGRGFQLDVPAPLSLPVRPNVRHKATQTPSDTHPDAGPSVTEEPTHQESRAVILGGMLYRQFCLGANKTFKETGTHADGGVIDFTVALEGRPTRQRPSSQQQGESPPQQPAAPAASAASASSGAGELGVPPPTSRPVAWPLPDSVQEVTWSLLDYMAEPARQIPSRQESDLLAKFLADGTVCQSECTWGDQPRHALLSQQTHPLPPPLYADCVEACKAGLFLGALGRPSPGSQPGTKPRSSFPFPPMSAARTGGSPFSLAGLVAGGGPGGPLMHQESPSGGRGGANGWGRGGNSTRGRGRGKRGG